MDWCECVEIHERGVWKLNVGQSAQEVECGGVVRMEKHNCARQETRTQQYVG